ncbi:MAG: hypothetical protein AAGU78_06575 [Chloroflexota bacterium]|nr:hypothetical protein [Anaerolineae bacterium]HMM28829.1 hypothetical protein [Aggregatilineaceae bacterium]
MHGSKWALMLVAGALLMAGLACGLVDDIRSVVETVDEAVKLLQELDDQSAWERVSNSLDTLAQQADGYAATLRLQEGPGDAAGTGFSGALSRDVVVTMQVDGANNALAQLQSGGAAQNYYVQARGADARNGDVYRVENGQFVCVSDSPEARLLRDGLSGYFDEFGLEAKGVQMLAVATKVDDEAVIAGRQADHYRLESRIPQAIEILRKFDNAELKRKLDEAGTFTLSGDLYTDETTGGLLKLESIYHNTDHAQRVVLTFEVTQWGGIAPIAPPAPEAIVQPCP